MLLLVRTLRFRRDAACLLRRVPLSDLKNKLAGRTGHERAVSNGVLDKGPSKETVALLDVIKRCFGGDPKLGDPVLQMRPKAAPARRTHAQWMDYIKSRPLVANWEATLERKLDSYIGDVIVQLVRWPFVLL